LKKKILQTNASKKRAIVSQSKVFQQWSKFWFWNQNGKQVGPFDSRHIAVEKCNEYLRQIQWNKKHNSGKIKNG